MPRRSGKSTKSNASSTATVSRRTAPEPSGSQDKDEDRAENSQTQDQDQSGGATRPRVLAIDGVYAIFMGFGGGAGRLLVGVNICANRVAFASFGDEELG